MRLPDWSGARWLFVFDATVLTGVGGMAFGGSANHVYHLALQHGQQGFGAISITALAEILFAYSGLEIRRREGKGKLIPAFWLILTAGFIVWANLESTSDHSFTGRLIAVAPAIVFAGVATTAETRKWGKVAPVAQPVGSGTPRVHAVARPPIVARPADPPPATVRPIRPATDTRATTRNGRQAALRDVGRAWLASQGTDAPLARQDVAERLRVSPQRASVLIKRWTDKPDLLNV